MKVFPLCNIYIKPSLRDARSDWCSWRVLIDNKRIIYQSICSKPSKPKTKQKAFDLT